LAEPLGVAGGERLPQGGTGDQHVVAAGRDPVQAAAPHLAQAALDAVAVDGGAGALRDGDPAPRLALVVAPEPVQDQEPRRDGAAVPVDGVEVPRAREPVAALHGPAPAVRRTAASGLWRGGASGSGGRPGWTCAPGSR